MIFFYIVSDANFLFLAGFPALHYRLNLGQFQLFF